jgi:hypothetical protein
MGKTQISFITSSTCVVQTARVQFSDGVWNFVDLVSLGYI